MNPLTRELFKRAGGKTSARNLASNPVQVVETHELWDDRIEKFAELIVRECGYHADVFESLGCPVDMDPTETKPSDYIKKHFGVEE